MHFLSNDNYNMLLEIVRENITTDTVLFTNMFKDFGNREKGSTIELNKQFLRILNDIVKNTPKTRKVSFDKQIDNHKQNFLSYMPKTPITPIFADMTPKEPLRNIDDLIKDTIASRQYESFQPQSSSKSDINVSIPIPSNNKQKILDIEYITNNTSEIYTSSPIVDLGKIEPSSNDIDHDNISNMLHAISTMETKIDTLMMNVSEILQYIKQNKSIV